jgi:hypothetical protein
VQLNHHLPNKRTLLKINLIFVIGILYEIYVGLNVVRRPMAPGGLVGNRISVRNVFRTPGESGVIADGRSDGEVEGGTAGHRSRKWYPPVYLGEEVPQ